MEEFVVGSKVQWVGFQATQDTPKGPIVFSPWSTRDGWTLYESTKKNVKGVSSFFVITDNSIVCAIVDIGNEDDVDKAFDKVDEAKKSAKRPAR